MLRRMCVCRPLQTAVSIVAPGRRPDGTLGAFFWWSSRPLQFSFRALTKSLTEQNGRSSRNARDSSHPDGANVTEGHFLTSSSASCQHL